MNNFLLFIIILCTPIMQISKKSYKGGVMTFTAASAVFGIVFFILGSGGSLEFTADILGYSVIFGAGYIATVVFSVLALKAGPISLSSLILSYSMIVPAFYGILVLDEQADSGFVCGIIFFAISLFLINMPDKTESKISIKWLIFVLCSFLGNGICATVQKIQQLESGGLYKNEFMIVALLTAVIALVFLMIFTERKTAVQSLKRGFWSYTVCGVSNGLSNLLVLTLANSMPASVMYPVMSAGGVVASALAAIVIYKEKLSRVQWLGMFFGIFAIIMLNLRY